MEFLSQSSKLVQDDVLQSIEVNDLKCSTMSLSSGSVSSGTFASVASALVGFSSVTPNPGFYQRIGNIVTYSFSFNVNYNSTANHSVEFTVPIASNFDSAADVRGQIQQRNFEDFANNSIIASIANNTLAVTMNLVGTPAATDTIDTVVQYIIK